MLPEREQIVLTLIGPDRPGLVEAVSEAVAKHQGNWLESDMARLAGQFAGILVVEVPAARVASISKDLANLSSSDLRVQIERGSHGETAGPRLQLELVGHDKPGIVMGVARLLAQRNVNVDRLSTQTSTRLHVGHADV